MASVCVDRRGAVSAFLLAALAGCSSIGGSDNDDCPDGDCGTDGQASGDASPSNPGPDGGDPNAPDAAPLGPFSDPEPIAALAHVGSDADPTLTADGLEMFFMTDRGGAGIDIWTSKRESVDDPWGDPDPVPKLNSADADYDPEISFDGLTIFLNSNRVVTGAKGGFDLFVATRTTRDAGWTTPKLVPELNSAEHDIGAVMDASQKILVFHRGTATGYDLYASTRDSVDDSWGDPMPLTGLNTTDYQEADAWLSPDGLTMYFNSNRPEGTGDSDIWRTTRLTRTSLWTVPEEVAEVNSEFHEANAALSLGERYIMLSTSRSGDVELYEASR